MSEVLVVANIRSLDTVVTAMFDFRFNLLSFRFLHFSWKAKQNQMPFSKLVGEKTKKTSTKLNILNL